MKPPSDRTRGFMLRSRARRLDAENQAETAAMVAAGRCECGCGLPATVGEYHAPCAAKRAAAKKNVFAGL